jgi:hypothetical protein
LDVWPDNWQAVHLFEALRTQWRVGPGGPYGIDYAAIEPTMRLMRIEADRDLFEAIRIMEPVAVKEMQKDTDG